MSDKFNPMLSQIRECRSLILDYLNSVFPSSLGEAELLEVMLSLDSPVDSEYVRRDLGYMQARGLLALEIVEHPVRKTKARRWKLTADGVSFIEHGRPWAEIERVS